MKFCYSCQDQMFFQMFGQTDQYQPGKQSQEYIKAYLERSKPVTCELCSRTVTYEPVDGRYQEIEQ